MPTARPYWKGYIKLALVSCPIAVYTASSSGERVAFRQLNKKTGNRLRQQLVDDVTREPVEAADKGRGYEYAKNAYLLIEDEEIESIEVESNHMIEIDSFVPRSQIDERYLDSPYYIGPNDPVGQEAFAVIREAMRGKDMVALGRVVIAKRERVIMLQPWEKGLLGTTLRYPYEVRDSKDYFYDIPDVKIAPDMLKLAEHILQSKEATFRSVPIRRPLRAGGASTAGKEAAGRAGAESASVRRPDQCHQSDGHVAPQHSRRGQGGGRAQDVCNHAVDRDRGREPEEGEKTRPRPGRAAAADCGAKGATQAGDEARRPTGEPAQVWIAKRPRAARKPGDCGRCGLNYGGIGVGSWRVRSTARRSPR